MISGAPDRNPALIIGDQTVSFGELRNHVEKARRALAHPPRRPVILKAKPTPAFIGSFLALFDLGCPVAVFSEAWSPIEFEKKKAFLQVACELDPESLEFPWQSPSGDSILHPETALILFTSGSSGEPKAVQLSRRNIEANVDAVIQALEFERAPEQTLILSLSYSFGLLGQLLPALKCGIPTRFVETFVHAKALFDSGQGRGMWSGVPSHWEAILRLTDEQEKIEQVTHVISAGAYLRPDLRTRLHARFPSAILFNNYGLTEASPRVLTLSSRDPAFFSTATGRPIGDWQVRLASDGELQMRGNQVMLGYMNDPDGTSRKITDTWLRSGDTATEMGGIYTIVGRQDELFNIGGERTSPNEIDSALKQVPGIADAAVVVEEHPIYGATLTGFVVITSPISARAISAAVAKILPAVKVPREFYRLEKMPTKPNGKLDRKMLAGLKQPDRKLP